MKDRSIPPHSNEVIECIMNVICSSGYRSVHYTGYAQEGLLRTLLSAKPKLKVTVMDMPDHWGTSYSFWYDERDYGDCLPQQRPDWLEGVPFYQEGAPNHKIAIHDWAWDSYDHLERIVTFTGRTPPKMFILLADGLMNEVQVTGRWEDGTMGRRTILRPMPFKHLCYDWEQVSAIWIGRWKKEIRPSQLRKLRTTN